MLFWREQRIRTWPMWSCSNYEYTLFSGNRSGRAIGIGAGASLGISRVSAAICCLVCRGRKSGSTRGADIQQAQREEYKGGSSCISAGFMHATRVGLSRTSRHEMYRMYSVRLLHISKYSMLESWGGAPWMTIGLICNFHTSYNLKAT